MYLGPLLNSIYDEQSWGFDSAIRSSLHTLEPNYYSLGTVSSWWDHDFYQFTTLPGYAYEIFLTSDSNSGYGWNSYSNSSLLEFDVVNAYGLIYASSIPAYDSFTDSYSFSSNSAQTLYVDVHGLNVLPADYALTIVQTYTGIANVNTSAVFASPVFISSTGTISPQAQISTGVVVYDVNGITNALNGIVATNWYLTGIDGVLDYALTTVGSSTEVDENWVGEALSFQTVFYDDLGFIEISPIYLIGEVTSARDLDTTPPRLIKVIPEDASLDIDPSASLVLTFDERIELGTGTIDFRTTTESGPIVSSHRYAGLYSSSGVRKYYDD